MQIVLRVTKFGPPQKGQLDLGVVSEFHVYTFRGQQVREGITCVVGENLSREPEQGEDIFSLLDEDSVEDVFFYTPDSLNWFDTL